MNKKTAIIYVILAALFYAFNTPISKIILDKGINEQILGGLLYLGSGIALGIYRLFVFKKEPIEEKYRGKDWLYVSLIAMLDVVAIICMLFGLKYSLGNTAALLSNFEVVATSAIACFFFKEKVSMNLWTAIGFITVSSIVLSLGGEDASLRLNIGSLFVIIATTSWGLENCIAKKLTSKSTSFLVFFKSSVTAIISLAIGFIFGGRLPSLPICLYSLLLGMVVFGASTFCFFKGLKGLGASKTSVYYASSPFISSFLCFIILGEKLTYFYLIGLALMVVGTLLVIVETLEIDIKKIFRKRVK